MAKQSRGLVPSHLRFRSAYLGIFVKWGLCVCVRGQDVPQRSATRLTCYKWVLCACTSLIVPSERKCFPSFLTRILSRSPKKSHFPESQREIPRRPKNPDPAFFHKDPAYFKRPKREIISSILLWTAVTEIQMKIPAPEPKFLLSSNKFTYWQRILLPRSDSALFSSYAYNLWEFYKV